MQFILSMPSTYKTRAKTIERVMEIFPDAQRGNGQSVLTLPDGGLIIATVRDIRHTTTSESSPLEAYGGRPGCVCP